MSMSPPTNPYSPPQTHSPMAPPMMAGPPPGSAVYAPCPNCQNVYAKKIGYTFWGGREDKLMDTRPEKLRHHIRSGTMRQLAVESRDRVARYPLRVEIPRRGKRE